MKQKNITYLHKRYQEANKMNEEIRQNKKGDEDAKKSMMAFFHTLRKKTAKQNQRTIKLPDKVRTFRKNYSKTCFAIQPFFIVPPPKLMYILEGCRNAYVEILSWSTDGTSIIIKKPKDFEEIICPLYFDKKCTFDSFSRKLRRWGFSTRRIPRSKVEGSLTDQQDKLWVCRHPYFTRSSAFQGSNKMCTATTSKKEVVGPKTDTIALMADSSSSMPMMMNHSPRPIPLLQRKSQHGSAVMATHLSAPHQHASSGLSNSILMSTEPSLESLEAQICQTQVQLRYEYERLLMLLTPKSPQSSLRSGYFPQFSGAYASYNIPLKARTCTPYSSLSANQRNRMMSSQKFVQQGSIRGEQAQEDHVLNNYRRAQHPHHQQQQQQLLMIGKPSSHNHQNRGDSSSGASMTSNFRRELPVRENDFPQSGFLNKKKVELHLTAAEQSYQKRNKSARRNQGNN